MIMIITMISTIIAIQMNMHKPRGCGQKWQIGQSDFLPVLLPISPVSVASPP